MRFPPPSSFQCARNSMAECVIADDDTQVRFLSCAPFRRRSCVRSSIAEHCHAKAVAAGSSPVERTISKEGSPNPKAPRKHPTHLSCSGNQSRPLLGYSPDAALQVKILPPPPFLGSAHRLADGFISRPRRFEFVRCLQFTHPRPGAFVRHGGSRARPSFFQPKPTTQ